MAYVGIISNSLNKIRFQGFDKMIFNLFTPSAPKTLGTLTNSVDPDQTAQNTGSDQGLHCLHYIHEFL